MEIQNSMATWKIVPAVPVSSLGKTWLSFWAGLKLPLLMCNMRGDDIEALSGVLREHLTGFMDARSNGRFRFVSSLIVEGDKIVFTDDLKDGYPAMLEISRSIE